MSTRATLLVRSLRWWWHTGQPPWRQRRASLDLINPAPLDKAALRGLMAMPKDDEDA